MKATALLLLLAVMTCAFEPSGDTWTPPEKYRAIWADAEACSGRTGDFDRVTWHLVPGHDFKCNSGRCIGEWGPVHHIAIAEDWQNIDWVVRHEIVHELTGYRHDGGKDGPGPRDIQVWGKQCKAMWGYLDNDPDYRP